MSPAAQHRVIRSGGGGGVFVLRMRTLWGVLLIFLNFFFFFNTIPSEQAHRLPSAALEQQLATLHSCTSPRKRSRSYP